MKRHLKSLSLSIGILSLITSSLASAQVINLKDSQIINTPTSYNYAVLNMTSGFTIKKGGVLDIENSTINVTISPTNPFFIYMQTGALILKNDVINVTAENINIDHKDQSLYQLLKIDKGLLTADNNQFTVNQPFTVGFLTTNQNFTTTGFNISNNSINNFHGGLYLFNSNQAEVDNNFFANVSLSNVFDMGTMSNYKGNIFEFPGNLSTGNAFDLVDSNNLTISDNIIESSSSFGILITGCQDLKIDNNKMTDGLSYGIYIQTANNNAIKKDKVLASLAANHKLQMMDNSNITISNNYFGQNRYGIAGGVVDNLKVTNNTFIQKFSDSASRQFWTNNDILLPSATNIKWTGNLYKEAFTQEVPGNNDIAKQFVVFPATDGVAM